MNKIYQGFGKHIWKIIAFSGFIGVGLITIRLLFPVLNPEHVGSFIYVVAGLILFYVMFKRYARNHTNQAGNHVVSEDTSPTWDSHTHVNDSTRKKVRDTIRSRKVYHKKLSEINVDKKQ